MGHGSSDTGDVVRTAASSLGVRRLLALRMLAEHPELDDATWSGRVEFHFGPKSVKGAIVPVPHDLSS